MLSYANHRRALALYLPYDMRVVSIFSSNFGRWITQSYFPNVSDSSLNMWSYYINPLFSVCVCVCVSMGTKQFIRLSLNAKIIRSSQSWWRCQGASFHPPVWQMRWKARERWHNKMTQGQTEECQTMPFFKKIWHPVVCAAKKKANLSGCRWRQSKWRECEREEASE